MSDAEVLIRSRTDPEALGVLYDRHAAAVHSYLARRAGRSVADDLLSEVFVAAVRARRRVRPHASGSALPWLYGIARNVVGSHFRSVKPSPSVHADAEVDWAAVDARIDASAAAADLRRALDGLSDVECEVLLLVAWEQLTITEAAAVLDITPTAARSRLHRARTRAAAALAATTGELT
ncbi:RNA polymerase sigma factor [Aeromicrobium fastidiosum]|uniref:RNA polymerase sigma factor n=1 Tax=Aeromicrobium fastidiosum TaxID=52699 RepID=A0A641APP8_9ACTN|nr:RNA polymerase sigma factor [Aeromicrobium fastidiosum]KAA1380076.1 RNA polymerase sigma factor [Aeromicrobium fastidiosum]MBP2389606.1 RNA polymerase sigma-70 factor (ECF subfamily) [Aeromicrobium fastidiosum]